MVWALAALYGSLLGEHLVFKGGTSLSKAYRVIRRFSEDVDLTYDIRQIAPDLVETKGEALPKTRSEEKRWSGEVRRRLPEWVAGTAQPVIASALTAEGLAATIRAEKAADRSPIDYAAAVSGGLRLVPAGDALKALKEDYARMVEDGLLLEDAESFETLMARCAEIAARANRASV